MANRPVATLTVFQGSGILGYSSWITFPVDEPVTEEALHRIGRPLGVRRVMLMAQDAELVVLLRRMPTLGLTEVIGRELSLDVGSVLGRQYEWDMEPLAADESTTVLSNSDIVLFDSIPLSRTGKPRLTRRVLEWVLELLLLQPLRIWIMVRMIKRVHPRR